MDIQKLASEIIIGLNIAYERNLPLPAVETVALVIREHIAVQQGVQLTGCTCGTKIGLHIKGCVLWRDLSVTASN